MFVGNAVYPDQAPKHRAVAAAKELFQSLDQSHGTGRRADFAFMDDISKDVTRRGFAFRRRFDLRQIIGRFSFRP